MIELAAFLLIILETYVFFTFVVPLGPIPHTLTDYTTLALLKMFLILVLGALWFVVLDGLTKLYVRTRVRNAPRPSS
ncbi:MAG: hypothetical protein JRM79_01225 [Nitrososphaerota archaeon]|jgi:hypothetical protein|nr:hypothetical protein [Nitrososphaerota archaeon]MCL5672158.1 hypothetical protein [Nitrososphaerota archaeon]MDG6924410.1 hypothetical protein [Nitrososphaerota archaeon]MDG6941137.1 hypothetical protein [Nitrososphaerota archaeon]MDG6945692.1 hypothetical protein [Nitrososphaerota archaeon]